MPSIHLDENYISLNCSLPNQIAIILRFYNTLKKQNSCSSFAICSSTYRMPLNNKASSNQEKKTIQKRKPQETRFTFENKIRGSYSLHSFDQVIGLNQQAEKRNTTRREIPMNKRCKTRRKTSVGKQKERRKKESIVKEK